MTLDPVSDEGPFDIHVSQPLSNGTLVTITIHDVLFGDVWICSGQSNMQFTVSMMFNATEEIRAPNGPGWADFHRPMGYQALAQLTHGFCAKKRPSSPMGHIQI